MESKKINVGGQAVIEGVMIRGLNNYTVAVRKNKKIIIKSGKIPSNKYKFLKWPFVRGSINLFEMLVIGIKSLMWSAQQAGAAVARSYGAGGHRGDRGVAVDG